MSTDKMQKNAVSISEEICRRLEKRLATLGMTREKLAADAGVSSRVVYKILQANARVRLSTLGKIAKALHCSVDYLVHGATFDIANETNDVVRDSADTFMYQPATGKPVCRYHTLESAVRIIADVFEMTERQVREEVLMAVMRIKNQKEGGAE